MEFRNGSPAFSHAASAAASAGGTVQIFAMSAALRLTAPEAPCCFTNAARPSLDTRPTAVSPFMDALRNASSPVPVAAPSTKIVFPGSTASVVNSARTTVPRFRMYAPPTRA